MLPSSKADDLSAKKPLDPSDDPKTQAYWSKRAKKLRDKLAAAEQELDVLQRELNKDQVQYYPDPQKALTQQYHNRSDINEKSAKVDAKKAEGRIPQATGGRSRRCRAQGRRRSRLGSLAANATNQPRKANQFLIVPLTTAQPPCAAISSE